MTNIERIYNLRQGGATLQEIADVMGWKSRERPRQLLIKNYGSTKIIGLYTSVKLAKLFGISYLTILEYRKRGLITPVNPHKKGAGTCALYNGETVRMLQSYFDGRKCPICGRKVPIHRHKYCSPECAKTGKYELFKRRQWRRFYRKIGKPIPPRLAIKDE